jgi:NitT/TauT family transport system permease protein
MSTAERGAVDGLADPRGERPLRRTASAAAVARRALLYGAAPLVFAALLLATWETWVRARDIREYLLPAPSAVLDAFRDDPSRYLEAGATTLYAAIGGLVIATAVAFGLAVVMAHSRTLERALYPPAVMIKVTPIVAVAPLFTIWFGFGVFPKMLIASLITFFPMLVNAVIGLRAIDPTAHEFMRSLNASRSQVFWRLRLPSSLPYVFAALRISVPLALIGAVVAEFLSGTSGMGQLILIANGDLDSPALFAAVFVLAAIGVVLTGIVSYIERRVLFWHESVTGV